MSPDLQTRARESDVREFYQIFFERDPDPGGLKYHRMLVSNGITRYGLFCRFTLSEEWQRLSEERKQRAREHFRQEFGMQSLLAQDIAWFHSVELPDGSCTQGYKSHEILQKEAARIFNFDLRQKSVLDIGAWDGFFSFEAERRGAASVLATDHFSWSGPGWGTKQGFDALHEALNSRAASVDVDVFDLDPHVHGRHDVVLFLGVLYHLKDPCGGLEKAAAMTREMLIVETETVFNYMDDPVMRYFSGTEMNEDDTNFWAPNLACLRSMVTDLGFRRCEFTPNYDAVPGKHTSLEGNQLFRYIVHAHR